MQHIHTHAPINSHFLDFIYPTICNDLHMQHNISTEIEYLLEFMMYIVFTKCIFAYCLAVAYQRLALQTSNVESCAAART